MSEGGAVLPTAVNVNVAGVLDGCANPLKLKTLNSYVPSLVLNISASLDIVSIFLKSPLANLYCTSYLVAPF